MPAKGRMTSGEPKPHPKRHKRFYGLRPIRGDREKSMIDDNSDRVEETTCQVAQKAPEMLRGAQSVMASLVSFGTISGERPFVPKSASIASEPAKKMIGAGCPGSRSRWIRGQRIGRECRELALQASP